MIEHHWFAKCRHARPVLRGRPSVAGRFGDHPRLIEQLVSFEYFFVIPGNRLTKAHPQPVHSDKRPARRARCLGPPRPFLKPWLYFLRQYRRFPISPVLPRKMRVPGAPAYAATDGSFFVARERQIADRDDVKTFVAG